LHTEVYRRTLQGKGFGLEDTYEAIAVVEKIRDLPVVKGTSKHPLLEG
jgi:UDP-N-acetyl-2-amino-2-deoxyglucuronate dehydrogenase